MAAITTRKIEAVVHTKIDAARRRTVAKTIALDRLSAFLGDAAPALQPPALPWVDLEIRPAFREPVEICVDCPEKATNGPAFKVHLPRLVRRLRGWSRLLDGVIGTTSRRWRHRDDVAAMASSSRDSSRALDGDASTGVSLDVMFWMRESQSHEVAKTQEARKKQEKNTQVLVLLEPEEVSRAAQRAKPNYFDLVLGHDAAAVAAARGKASAPFAHGGTWVPRDVWAAPPRSKAPKASLVCGDKKLTRGHRIRRAVWDAAAADARIVRFASEHSKLPRDKGVRVLAAAPEAKAGSVAPFAVHVAIENVRRAGYFTEKLLDCFLLRTVPVYWGCPDLAAHGFDVDGVVFIDDGGDVAAVARAAVAAVGRALDAPPPAAAIERNYARAQDFLDLEGRLVASIDAALIARERDLCV